MMSRLLMFGLLAGCDVYATHVQIAGTTGSQSGRQRASALRQALMQQASKELECPHITISVHADVLRASGCSKHAIYTQVNADMGEVETVAFVNLGTATFGTLGLYDQALVTINEEASKDLGCDRNEVVPELVSLGSRSGLYEPIAMGCGRRATYVPIPIDTGARHEPLRLASRIDSPESAADFGPWTP
jgi:hypothetical protein